MKAYQLYLEASLDIYVSTPQQQRATYCGVSMTWAPWAWTPVSILGLLEDCCVIRLSQGLPLRGLRHIWQGHLAKLGKWRLHKFPQLFSVTRRQGRKTLTAA